MYHPYPSAGQEPEPVPPQVTPPRSVLMAVRLMYLGAALSLIEIVVQLSTVSNLRNAIRTADPSFTASQVHDAEVFALTFVAVVGVLAIGLWLWMAWANGAGKSWARIVASALFGIDTVDLLTLITRPHATVGLLFALLVWLVGLGTIVLLWQRDSSAYFQARSPRYPRPPG